MTSNRTWRLFLAILTAAVLTLTACSKPAEKPEEKPTANPTQPADPSKPVDGGTLTIGTTSDIVTLNPFMYDDVSSGELIQLLFASLYDIDSSGNLAADEWALAAEMPKVSADQKTYTVKLKPGIKWSDGTPITAADVAFTMNT
ncbi:MAG TPA: ABC transporter substrate-binding protein, partial [Symbiobacteriaceae bacterium]|nr:ABC transporter substrate-binding protein [Symbiobacteriaceae bacterium]